jgi:opacity protein-like surface antigen
MKRLILLVLALCLAAEPALAASIRRAPRRMRRAPVAERTSSVGVVLRGGLSSYAMRDLNDFLAASNYLEGTSFEEVNGGGSFGAALRLWASREVMLEVGYDRLTGTSEESASAAEVDLGADLAMASLGYFPPSYGDLSLGFGGGVGIVSSAARTRGTTERADLGGTGPAFYLFGALDIPVGTNAAFTVDGGYRYAVVSDVNSVFVPPNLDLDWSGPTVRAGLAIYFP